MQEKVLSRLIAFRISPEDHRLFCLAAKARGISVSRFIREALRAEIDRELAEQEMHR